MKKTLIIIFVVFLFFTSRGFSQSYQLVWFENFDGSELDTNSWKYETGGNWYNNEIQYYTDREKNIRLENSKLIIEAHKEDYGNRNHTSARIKTQGKKFFKYGRIDARIKLPRGQGIWPAFWMMGENEPSVGWPACGEIDVVEMIGGSNRERTIYGTAHWSHNGSHAEYGGMNSLASGAYSDDFHVYSIEWNEQEIKWLVDGNQYHVIDITPSQLSEFHQEFFFLLNVAVGGDWPGYPDQTTEFPQRMEVDYIRVVQYLPTAVDDIEQNTYEMSFSIYPNPFNSAMNILVNSNSAGRVDSRIEILNTLGQVIHAEKRKLSNGTNKISWSPSFDLNSGVYFIRLSADNYYQTKKVVYLK